MHAPEKLHARLLSDGGGAGTGTTLPPVPVCVGPARLSGPPRLCVAPPLWQPLPLMAPPLAPLPSPACVEDEGWGDARDTR